MLVHIGYFKLLEGQEDKQVTIVYFFTKLVLIIFDSLEHFGELGSPKYLFAYVLVIDLALVLFLLLGLPGILIWQLIVIFSIELIQLVLINLLSLLLFFAGFRVLLLLLLIIVLLWLSPSPYIVDLLVVWLLAFFWWLPHCWLYNIVLSR